MRASVRHCRWSPNLACLPQLPSSPMTSPTRAGSSFSPRCFSSLLSCVPSGMRARWHARGLCHRPKLRCSSVPAARHSSSGSQPNPTGCAGPIKKSSRADDPAPKKNAKLTPRNILGDRDGGGFAPACSSQDLDRVGRRRCSPLDLAG